MLYPEVSQLTMSLFIKMGERIVPRHLEGNFIWGQCSQRAHLSLLDTYTQARVLVLSSLV